MDAGVEAGEEFLVVLIVLLLLVLLFLLGVLGVAASGERSRFSETFSMAGRSTILKVRHRFLTAFLGESPVRRLDVGALSSVVAVLGDGGNPNRW